MCCLTLDRQSFETLLGPLNEILVRNAEAYDSNVGTTRQKSKGRMDIDLTDLKRVAILGRGSFGVVELVHHVEKNTKKVLGTYASKKVSKGYIANQRQAAHLIAEKECNVNAR
eukprot:UN19343